MGASSLRASIGDLRRIKMVIGYDGTDFAGFQRQKGKRTVQSVLEDSIEQLTGEKTKVRGAGRTDSGVHAKGQVIAFSTASAIPGDRFAPALRGILPEDILAVCSEETQAEFDPLRHAVDKTYCYRIWRGSCEHLFLRRFSYWYPGNLDFQLLEEKARLLLGTKDFRNLRAEGSSAKTTVRTVKRAQWVKKSIDGVDDALWEFWIQADGFLYKMVRMIVGTLIDEARGILPPGTLEKALDPKNTEVKEIKVGTTVPGKGLCLEEVRFEVRFEAG